MPRTPKNTLTATGTLEAAWYIKGRGKKATYWAKLPQMLGNPGSHIQLTSQAGVVTTGTLVEVMHREDGYECWSFVRDQKTPEQLAHDRALKLQHNAQYWASDKGKETAQKIRERQERAAANQQQSSSQQATEQAAPITTTVQGPVGNTVDTTALAVALKAAGFGPLEVAKAILEATGGVQQVTATVPVGVTATIDTTPTQEPEPNVVPIQSTKRGPGRPKGSTSKPTVKNTAAIKGTKSGCVACGKRTTVLHKHTSGNVDGVCTTCMALPAEQVRTMAIARMAQ